MSYATINFPTKKALKEAVKEGRRVGIRPELIGQTETDGEVFLEGPWSPKPHIWYAQAVLENGIIVSVR